MKNQILVLTILATIAIHACTLINSNDNNEVKRDLTNNDEIPKKGGIIVPNDPLNYKDNKIKEPQIRSEDILNKVFYYITKTDSGDVVVDYQECGINGVGYTKKEEYGIGYENYRFNLDSIVVLEKCLNVYISSLNVDEKVILL